MTRGARIVIVLGTLLLAVSADVGRVQTHKLITSTYTYNEDVFPILRDRCGRCHVEGGVAPMSLMSYKDAYPWAESLRAELIAGHMPPWGAQDGIGAFKNAPPITATEIDTVLTWASGGHPEGNPLKMPPAVTLAREWPLGEPDLVLQAPSEATIAADTSELTQEFTLPTGMTAPRWVRAVDLRPEAASIVRSAVIGLRPHPKAEAGAPEQMLGAWLPGEDPVPADGGAAFQLPAGAELTVRIHYKKTYRYDGKPISDRSSIGVYFAETAAAAIRRFTVTSPPITAVSGTHVIFGSTIDEDIRALALSPDPSLSNASLQVDLISPAGARTPVIRLGVRPDWTRRYWFQQPLALPRGSRIEIIATLNDAETLLPPAASATPPQPVNGSSVRVMFDVVPAQDAHTAP